MMKKVLLMIAAAAVFAGCSSIEPYRTSGYFTSPALMRHEGKTIAVLPFKGGASDPATDIANLEIGRLNRWRLVERIRIQELYNEQDFDPERIDDAMAVKIGKMLGAYGVILGQVYEYTPGRCSVSLRLVETETGEHLWQARDTLLATSASVQKLASDRYDSYRLRKDPEALASVTIRELVRTMNER